MPQAAKTTVHHSVETLEKPLRERLLAILSKDSTIGYVRLFQLGSFCTWQFVARVWNAYMFLSFGNSYLFYVLKTCRDLNKRLKLNIWNLGTDNEFPCAFHCWCYNSFLLQNYCPFACLLESPVPAWQFLSSREHGSLSSVHVPWKIFWQPFLLICTKLTLMSLIYFYFSLY